MVMHNSSNSYNPKSSKYCEDSEEQTKDHTDDDNFNGGTELNDIPTFPTIVICHRDGRQRGGRPRRGRESELPPFKSGDRSVRGSRGTRSGTSYAYRSRDGESSNFSSRTKEFSSRGNSYKHLNDSIVFKNKDALSLLPEDCRISKLLRRMCQETDLEKFFAIAKQLKESLLLPDNSHYIRRSIDYILDSLLDILHCGPSSDARIEGAKCLGVAGVALDQDAKRLIDWVFATYNREKSDDVRVLLLKAIQHMLEIDSEHPNLGDLTRGLMTQLQQTLESTDKPEILYASGDTILALYRTYPETFSKFFRDTVDILIGWHIDTSQPTQVTYYASQALQQLRPCLIADLPFSLNLLSQFLEDMEAYTEDLVQPQSGRSTPEDEPAPSAQDCLSRITSIIQVFTTVTRSLDQDLNPREGSPVKLTFLIESLEKVITTALTALEHPDCKELTIVAANESAYLLLGAVGARGSSENLYLFINKQLEMSTEWAYWAILSSLSLTAKTVRECSANLPESMIHQLLAPGSILQRLRFGETSEIQDATLEVYHSLLSLKNIPLLQETYRYILQDLQHAYSLLVPFPVALFSNGLAASENNPYKDIKNAEEVVIFLLKAVADIAQASNSIIGMWALKPTIMELLAVSLLPEDDTLTFLSPSLQFSIVYLLYAHCSRYNNFVSSTGLVISGRSIRPQICGVPPAIEMSASPSPTSGNLSLILRLLTNVFSKTGVWLEVELLCLRWAKELITEANTSLIGLISTPNFSTMLSSLITVASSKRIVVAAKVADCFKTLFSLLPNPIGNEKLLEDILKLCLLHLDSPKSMVRESYHQLLLMLPWHLVTINISRFVTKNCNSITGNKNVTEKLIEQIQKVSRIHSSRVYTGEMDSQNFKRFMVYMLQGSQESDSDWLRELLSASLPMPLLGTVDGISWLSLAVGTSFHARLSWSTWHAAQFCVALKLRTPLGKPMETFNSIEGAIKGLARELNSDSGAKMVKSSDDASELQRARLLLSFLEHLEKNIYNAAEGCAFAMLLPSKPVRVFFHTNKAVCAEWTCRIRWATILVALHSGMPSITVRQGFALLQDLVDQGNAQGVELERAMVLVASALVTLKESETLQGLYTWCKDKAARKLPWLKAASLHAAARYEEAAVDYIKLIYADNSENPSDTHVTSFIFDQMFECLRLLGDWSKLLVWKENYQDICKTHNQNLLKTFSSSLSIEHVKALSDFDQLAVPPRPDNTNMSQGCWTPNKVLASVEEHLTCVAFDLARDTAEQTSRDELLDESKSCLQKMKLLMEECLHGGPADLCSNVALLEYTATALINYMENHQSPSNTFLYYIQDDIGQFGSSLLCKIISWSKLLQQIDQSSSSMSELHMIASRSARKEGNIRLAHNLLCTYWKDKMNSEVDLSKLNPSVWVKEGSGLALKETAKLLYSSNMTAEATNLLANSALEYAKCAAEDGASVECQEIASCLLSSLNKKCSTPTIVHTLPKLFDGLNIKVEDIPVNKLHAWIRTVADLRKLAEWDIKTLDNGDFINQKLLELSLVSCPRNTKAWSQFAAWCYRLGRHATEWEEDGVADVEREKVANILGAGDVCDLVFCTLQELRQHGPEDDEISDIKTTLSSLIPNTMNDRDNKLEKLVSLWGQKSQIHSYYHACAVAYFKFLQLCEGHGNDDESYAEITLTATLRLLRLTVKHATTLQDVLDSGFALTPTTPWKGIIPQLFARLSHPETYVRKRLSELLCRLASDAPHLILFPAVVGCSSDQVIQKNDSLLSSFIQDSDDADEIEDEEDEDSTADDGQNSVLRSCFLAMVDTLSQQASASTAQVCLLVSELKRITVLWDELWLGCLIQHQLDVTKRLSQIETEIRRSEQNDSLTPELRLRLAKEKYRIILKPTIVLMEHLRSITSVTPETPHEKSFQNKYSHSIDEALKCLKNPPENIQIKPQACWQPFRQLQSKLHQAVQKRGAHSLKLSEISPALANMKDSAIAMPGLSQSQPLVTIAALDNTVTVLPTKTRPKKLVLTGSDGRSYPYLFKGLEDLHLDERIMQFLSIANTMMARKEGAKFQAHHYSVVPLGARSGLISWVDGTQPMFALYKRWQQRENTVQQLRNAQSAAQISVPRPSELFYSKLQPLLSERGISIENRKEWPTPVLKQVLTVLMAETPKDLLAKELWCTSEDAADWWRIVSNYSRSVAVMSVIGYIIGLGDRHLDNLLINLATGEVVHIDYNVCFEKGRTLRVPEKVPFRMTPNLQAALGVTGVEGIFRVSCEQVLKILKRGRETLLTLLEAFVYDPLIDWTPGNEAGYTGAAFGGIRVGSSQPTSRPTRRELERETAHDMLAVRLTEMKEQWIANRDELACLRTQLHGQLSCWLTTVSEDMAAKEEFADVHQQMALLKEAIATGPSHLLYSLHARHAAHIRASNARSRASMLLEGVLAQAKQKNIAVQDAICSVLGAKLSSWVAELKHLLPSNGEVSPELFDLVHEFLHSAGQVNILAQCEKSEAENSRLMPQLQLVLRACLELLGNYRMEAALFPSHCLECVHTRQQAHVAEELLANLTSERCRASLAQIHALCQEPSIVSREQAEQHQMQLQHAAVVAQTRLQGAYARLPSEEGNDPTLRLESALALAKEQLSVVIEEPGAGAAFAAAAVQSFCDVNSGLLALETAASNSGESLVDLTLREGDWFFDKLLQLSSIAALMADSLLPVANMSAPGGLAVGALRCLLASNAVYKRLEDMLWNVSSIIVPETMSALTTKIPSVIALVHGLRELTLRAEKPLNELCKDLEVNIRFHALDLPVPHPNVQRVCNNLREGLDQLLQAQMQSDTTLSQGQMLIMGFNGLFEVLQNDTSKLISALATLNLPSACNKIDQIVKARHLSWSAMKLGSQRIMDDLFLLHRLQVMHDFFNLCAQSASGFVGLNGLEGNDIHVVGCYVPEEGLIQPVRRFAADFVRLQLIGLQPQAIAVAMCALLEEILGFNITEHVEQREVGAESRVSMTDVCRRVESRKAPHTTAMLVQLDHTWRQRESARLAQRDAEAAAASVQRLQLRIAAHAWLNDLPQCRRPAFLTDLRQAMSSLMTLQTKLADVCGQQKTLVSLVTQRLKWAAGANPILSEVLSAFNSRFASRQAQIRLLQLLGSQLVATSTAILHLETLRNNTDEAMAYHSSFIHLLGQCEQDLSLVEVADSYQALSTAEKGLTLALPLEQPVDINWLLTAEALVTARVKQLSNSLTAKRDARQTALENVLSTVDDLKDVLTEHHSLVGGVRALLRTLTKLGEGHEHLNYYLLRYQKFTDQFASVVRSLPIEELNARQAEIAQQQLDDLEPLICPIYDDLLKLPLISETLEPKVSGRPPLVRQQVVCESPQHAAQPVKLPPTREKVPQEKNAYALSVWRKVRHKLEGKDPDPSKKASVPEQVDFIISEATSLGNLCLLYEGWTPWV